MIKNKLVILVISMLASSAAFADLVVNTSIIIYDDPAVSKKDVVVFNTDELLNLYLEVNPYKVINPGMDDQEMLRITLDDEPEFLASPNRVIVAPKGRSLIRMLNLQFDDKEEVVYRVNLIPITPPVELIDNGIEDIESRLEIVIAYQVLVIVLPANPLPVVVASRDAKLAIFGNTGNANYLLTDGEQCNPQNLEECIVLEDRRVYPGNNWSLNLPFDGPFSYKVKTSTGLTAKQYD